MSEQRHKSRMSLHSSFYHCGTRGSVVQILTRDRWFVNERIEIRMQCRTLTFRTSALLLRHFSGRVNCNYLVLTNSELKLPVKRWRLPARHIDRNHWQKITYRSNLEIVRAGQPQVCVRTEESHGQEEILQWFDRTYLQNNLVVYRVGIIKQVSR